MKVAFWTAFADEGVHPAELGRALEERGFEGLFPGEHTNLPVHDDQPVPDPRHAHLHPRFADPLVTLSVVAA